MEEATAYRQLLRMGWEQGIVQGILKGEDRGRVLNRRETLLELGGLKFRTPAPPEVVAALDQMTDLNRLKELTRRVLTASSWEELMADG